MGKQCTATRRDGSPCRAPASGDDGLCFAHRGGPEVLAARRRGGKNRSRQARAMARLPERLRPVADMLAEALDELHGGKLDPRCGSAMAAVAGALVRVTTAGEIEQRLVELEAQLTKRSVS